MLDCHTQNHAEKQSHTENMNKTAALVAALIVFSAVIAALASQVLSELGYSVFVPSYTFVFACLALALIQIILAIRIKLVLVKGKRAINPAFAYRILALARSYILAGSLFFGFFSGTALYFVRGGFIPEKFYLLIPPAIASLIVIIAGVISKFLLRIPKNHGAAANLE